MSTELLKNEYVDDFSSGNEFDLVEFYLSNVFAKACRTNNMQQNLGKL